MRILASPAFWLTTLVGVSTLIRSVLSGQVPSPSILPDELLYSELSRSIAHGSIPAVRGVQSLGWGEIYPTVIAPAWLLFDDPVRAYHAALVINSFVMSLAVVPAYFLARMFVSRSLSLAVAASTVLIPSMVYTSVVMTENAFYPVFLLALLVTARAVRAPTTANQALALCGLALATLTRVQGVVLVAAYLIAAVLYASQEPSPRGYVRRFWPTAFVILTLATARILQAIARGDGSFGWLGERSETLNALNPGELPVWFMLLVADLVLYVAAAPILATAIVTVRGLMRGASEPARLFAAIGGTTFVALLVSISVLSASLDVDGFENLNERYVFYLVPVAFIGLAMWIEEGLPRPWLLAVVAVIGGSVLALALPVQRLGYNARFQSPALLPWLKISTSEAAISMLMGGFVLACGAIWILSSRRRVWMVWLVPCAWMVLAGTLAVDRTTFAAKIVARSYPGGEQTWVDQLVERGAGVTVVWDQRRADRGRPDDLYGRLTLTEFFNRRVTSVVRIGGPTYYENILPTVPVRLADDLTLHRLDGDPLHTAYALTTCRSRVAGGIVGQASEGRLVLVRVNGPVRLTAGGKCP